MMLASRCSRPLWPYPKSLLCFELAGHRPITEGVRVSRQPYFLQPGIEQISPRIRTLILFLICVRGQMSFVAASQSDVFDRRESAAQKDDAFSNYGVSLLTGRTPPQPSGARIEAFDFPPRPPSSFSRCNGGKVRGSQGTMLH